MINAIAVIVLIFTMNGEAKQIRLETASPQHCAAEADVARNVIIHLGGRVEQAYCLHGTRR